MVRTFSYNGSGYLKLVEDSTGYAIVFDYNGNGDVTAACGFNRAVTYVNASSTCTGAALKTTYGYTYDGLHYVLTSAVDVLGQTTSYTNSRFGVTCIKEPGSAVCKLSITGSSYGRNGSPAWSFTNVTETMADGSVWNIAGEDDAAVKKNLDDAQPPYNGHNQVTVTDPDNAVISASFTKTSPWGLTDPNGNSTSFVFQGASMYDNPWTPATADGTMLVQATYPEGDQYLAEYRGPLHAISKETRVPKPGSGLPSLVKEYGYQSCTVSPGTYQNCTKPIWIRDPKGNQTDFYYEPHGGIRYEMDPAPTAGAARPLKMTTWVQRYAWIKGSGGTLVQAAAAEWVKASETQCQAVPGSVPSPTTTCDPAQQQTTTTYEYGATGAGESLLVKGVAVTSGGTTLRTCFGYDAWHRKISETKPNANLAACP
jgi:hypothetical protein